MNRSVLAHRIRCQGLVRCENWLDARLRWTLSGYNNMTTANRLTLISLCLALAGCSPKVPSFEIGSQDAFNKHLPSLANANTVHILCWPPYTSDRADAFTKASAEGLADRLRKEGFRPKALIDDATPTPVETVTVYRTRSEVESSEKKNADVTIHIRMDEHTFEGEFEKNTVRIETSYKAKLWVYGNESNSPFTINWSGGGTSSSTKEDSSGVATPPTWSDFGYSETEDTRLNNFAKKCGAGCLDAINNFSAGS